MLAWDVSQAVRFASPRLTADSDTVSPLASLRLPRVGGGMRLFWVLRRPEGAPLDVELTTGPLGIRTPGHLRRRGRGHLHPQRRHALALPKRLIRRARRVSDRTVACMSVGGQILGHIRYDPDDQDRQDMRLLQERFGCVLPAPYDEMGNR